MADSKVKALVAEDCPTNQLVIKLMLEKLGVEVDLAADGAEAVEMAEENDYDLIFMDIQMPNMNGYEATVKIKTFKKAVPVIAVTAHAMVGDRDKCVAAGCDDYITKPIIKDKLAEIIEKHCCSRY